MSQFYTFHLQMSTRCLKINLYLEMHMSNQVTKDYYLVTPTLLQKPTLPNNKLSWVLMLHNQTELANNPATEQYALPILVFVQLGDEFSRWNISALLTFFSPSIWLITAGTWPHGRWAPNVTLSISALHQYQIGDDILIAPKKIKLLPML